METLTPSPTAIDIHPYRNMPTTRYQGSKSRVLKWIYECVSDLAFDSVLDAFGGTGVVSCMFKRMGKHVVYNDYLLSNYWSGVALIENRQTYLVDADLAFLLSRHEGFEYPTFISDTFGGIYYTDEENLWLDQTVSNIRRLDLRYDGETLRIKTAIAYHALCQSCLMKRPFNLFHRKNLYIRTADVARSFGNKTTWDTPFPDLFRRSAAELNRVVWDNGAENEAMNIDALLTPTGHDLVYVDMPYLSPNTSGVNSDYHSLYHFLDGLCQYPEWAGLIDYATPNLRQVKRANGWNDKAQVLGLFEEFVKRHEGSSLVVSYRTPGIPTREDLEALLMSHKRKVRTFERAHSYALSRRNGQPGENIEILIIGAD